MTPYVDLHCDTIMGCIRPDFSLRQNQMHVDLLRLKKADAMAQCFAVFLPTRDDFREKGMESMTDDEYISLAVRTLREQLAQNSDLVLPAFTAEQVRKNFAAGKMSALLTMEDGRALDNRLEKLDAFYEMGFRMIALLWNFENCLGFPNSNDPAVMSAGLKPFGKEAVLRMQELGMIVDVSHLSEGGFWDVADLVKGPFVASHSNARALSPHRRNLDDGQLRALAEHGGVTGINFCPPFLDETGAGGDSTVELMVRHAKHIVKVAGIDTLCIGSDLDGIGGNYLEICSADDMVKLIDGLSAAGFTDGEVEKIAWKNALRVWEEVAG